VPFWEEAPAGTDPRDQFYRTPEFRPPFKRDYPERVHSGGGSDRWFNYFALNKKAGVMQYVAGVPFGAPIRFTSWLQLWSSNDNNQPATSTNDGNLLVRVCVDQDGGPRNMEDPELKCSDWAQPYDKWAQLSVDAVAKNNVVNVFIWSTASIPVEHNDIYADDSCFEVLGAASDKGICKGAGFVGTGWGVQPLPANYAAIKSQAASVTVAAPADAAAAAKAGMPAAPAGDKPALTVNAKSKLNLRATPAANGKVVGNASGSRRPHRRQRLVPGLRQWGRILGHGQARPAQRRSQGRARRAVIITAARNMLRLLFRARAQCISPEASIQARIVAASTIAKSIPYNCPA
jgi:hypothetical protein